MTNPPNRTTTTTRKEVDAEVAAILRQAREQHDSGDVPTASPIGFTMPVVPVGFTAPTAPVGFIAPIAATGFTTPGFTAPIASAPVAPVGFTVPAGFSTASAEGFVAPRRRSVHIIRRVVVPPLRDLIRRGARWVLPAEELHYAYGELNGDHLWEPGDGIDFDDAAEWAASNAGCVDYDEHDGDRGEHDGGGHRHPLVARRLEDGKDLLSLVDLDQPFCDDSAAGEFWTTRLRPQLVAVRNAVLADPATVLPRDSLLSGLIARRALAWAGHDFEPGLYSGNDLVGLLLQRLGDDGFADALADLIALEHPQLVPAGAELAATYSEMPARDLYLHHPECLQFFCLDQAAGALAVDLELTGLQVINQCRYRSQLCDDSSPGRPMVIGWREVTLTPA